MKVSDLFDPLLVGLAVLLAGLVLWRRALPKSSARIAQGLAWAAFAWLCLASCPQVANGLVTVWQLPPADIGAALNGTTPEQRAMVVLAAGRRTTLGFVPPVEQLDGESQGRLLGAARLYHQFAFGMVVLTGTGQEFVDSMTDLLVQLGVPRDRIVQETRATDTKENARYSALLLAARHPRRVVLVTSALHMRRAVRHFRQAGIDVVVAPVDHQGGPSWKILPSSKALSRTRSVLHEIIGMIEP